MKLFFFFFKVWRWKKNFSGSLWIYV